MRFEQLARDSPKRRVDLELRVLDVVFALLFGVLALPLCAVIAVAAAVTSGFPVLYRGQRVGRSGRVFTIAKFRTLERDAEVRHGYETSMAEKLAHDLEWIADRSVRLYLRTLFATAWRVLRQSLHV